FDEINQLRATHDSLLDDLQALVKTSAGVTSHQGFRDHVLSKQYRGRGSIHGRKRQNKTDTCSKHRDENAHEHPLPATPYLQERANQGTLCAFFHHATLRKSCFMVRPRCRRGRCSTGWRPAAATAHPHN